MKYVSRARLAAAALALIATPVSSPARADYPGYVKSACKKDFKQFCPSYQLGSNSLRQCMSSAYSQLSPRCIDALKRSGERRR